MANVKVEFYLDIYETVKEPKITQPVSTNVKGRRVLVVDDVADSGKSLKLVKEHLAEQGASDVKICAIYYKPWSILLPDYYARKTEAWIIFPWERWESIKKIGNKLRKQGKSLKEIEDELVMMGLERSLVREFLHEILRESG